jgi:large subunit ribosomal protein L28
MMYECDLAILDIQAHKEEFYKNAVPLEFGVMPNKTDKIFVVGFPLGGSNLSIASGIVNRLEAMSYYENVVSGVTIQIDATVNPGNSGGPGLNSDGKIVGVTVSKISTQDVSNIGFLIPITFLKFFLHRHLNGNTLGLCDSDMAFIKLINPVQREFLGLTKESGVLVSGIGENSIFYKKIKPGDILLKLDDKQISSNGNMYVKDILDNQIMDPKERLLFTNLLSLKHPGQTVKATVLRNKKELDIIAKVSIPDYIVPLLPYDKPQFLSISGLLFVPLSYPVLLEKFKKRIPSHLTDYLYIKKKFLDQQLVFLIDIFQSEITHGYGKTDLVLLSVNNIMIKNLKHLNDTVRNIIKSKKKFIVFTFDSGDNYIFRTGEIQIKN